MSIANIILIVAVVFTLGILTNIIHFGGRGPFLSGLLLAVGIAMRLPVNIVLKVVIGLVLTIVLYLAVLFISGTIGSVKLQMALKQDNPVAYERATKEIVQRVGAFGIAMHSNAVEQAMSDKEKERNNK